MSKLSMVLFYAHCVINMNISASVSGLHSGNVIQFGASVTIAVFYRICIFLRLLLPVRAISLTTDKS